MKYENVPLNPFRVPKDIFEKHFPEFEKNWKGFYINIHGNKVYGDVYRAFTVMWDNSLLPGMMEKKPKKQKPKDDKEVNDGDLPANSKGDAAKD
jgi:hypothetical protein